MTEPAIKRPAPDLSMIPTSEFRDADTIVAVSTPVGYGAIGIVRLSGTRAVEIADRVVRLVRQTALAEAGSHSLTYGHVVDPESGRAVDEVLALVMRSPQTYTREDVVEIHCHGGPAAQRAVLRLLVDEGARPAEPGEFTRRAFLNGRIDLTQAEAVAALVQARSGSALRAAVRQLEGGLGDSLRVLRRRLVVVLAALEVGIDFSDGDVEEPDRAENAAVLADVHRQLSRLLETAYLGRELREGVRTAIVGRPNVGKSSLLNALVMRERAIVSEVPGTTRDTVEEFVEVAGVPLHLVDTAGLRPSEDHVEQLGMERSRRAIQNADLVLAVVDLAEPLDVEDTVLAAGLDPARTIVVGNKVDLAPGQLPLPDAGVGWKRVAVSALSGEGLDELRALIESVVAGEGGFHLEEPLLATERQRALVDRSAAAVEDARRGLESGLSDELVCEDVRGAVGSLGSITGEDLVPDLLDEVFSRFCIGK